MGFVFKKLLKTILYIVKGKSVQKKNWKKITWRQLIVPFRVNFRMEKNGIRETKLLLNFHLVMQESHVREGRRLAIIKVDLTKFSLN